MSVNDACFSFPCFVPLKFLAYKLTSEKSILPVLLSFSHVYVAVIDFLIIFEILHLFYIFLMQNKCKVRHTGFLDILHICCFICGDQLLPSSFQVWKQSLTTQTCAFFDVLHVREVWLSQSLSFYCVKWKRKKWAAMCCRADVASM